MTDTTTGTTATPEPIASPPPTETAPGAPDPPPNVSRVIVDLPDDAVEAVETLAGQLGTNRTQVLKQAIARMQYLEDQAAQGKKLLIADPDGTLNEVRFK